MHRRNVRSLTNKCKQFAALSQLTSLCWRKPLLVLFLWCLPRFADKTRARTFGWCWPRVKLFEGTNRKQSGPWILRSSQPSSLGMEREEYSTFGTNSDVPSVPWRPAKWSYLELPSQFGRTPLELYLKLLPIVIYRQHFPFHPQCQFRF